MTMPDTPIEILRVSAKPNTLKAAAQKLAASERPEDHVAVTSFLTSTVFLERLNTLREYQIFRPKRLRLWAVLDVLLRNKAPSARQVLINLTTAAAYNDDEIPARSDLLIQACARIRPAPPPVVAYWNKYCQPDDGHAPLTIEAMLENSSSPALALLEAKMADPGHDVEERIAWMRTSILPRRNEIPVLKSCSRMLGGSLPQPLRPALVETLFDYRPAEWYTPSNPVSCPPRQKMSAEARIELRAIGEMALKQEELTLEQQTVVKSVLIEIGGKEK
jgi:hypothetical protein